MSLHVRGRVVSGTHRLGNFQAQSTGPGFSCSVMLLGRRLSSVTCVSKDDDPVFSLIAVRG